MVDTSRRQSKGNTQVDFAALRKSLTTQNPVVAATLRNATPRNGSSPERDEINGNRTVNPYKLEKLSNIISNNINAATDLRLITPYIDKATLIWQTCLLYPNGKQDKILTYDTQPSPIKNTKLHDELLTIWDGYYTNDYKIEKDLREMIADILFNTGSYVLFNLSRPGLDYLINGAEQSGDVAGNEQFMTQAKEMLSHEFVVVDGKVRVKNKGVFVGNRTSHNTNNTVSGLESLFLNPSSQNAGVEFNIFEDDKDSVSKELAQLIDITLTDNPAVLYLQKFEESKRRSNVAAVTGAEGLDLIIQTALVARTNPGDDQQNYTDADGKKRKRKKPADPQATTVNLTEGELNELSNRLFPQRNPVSQIIQFSKPVDALKIAPYGRGITYKVPSEAVIPIHINGSNGTQTDFILLTDPRDGSFLKNTNDFEYYQSNRSNASMIANRPKNGSTNNLVQQLRQIQEGKECDFDMTEFIEISKSNIIRRYMQSVLSGRGENISIEIDEEANKIFLQRIFRRQGIRCLYVPGEAMTYMALNYNRLGIGQSLTQMAKMHIARLAALDLADALANLEAATPHTQMTINLQENDAEPFAGIAATRAAFFEANPRLHSILSTSQLSVPMIVDTLRENSLTVKVNAGENPYFPASDIQLDQLEKNIFRPVDQNSRTELLNKIANYFHLSRSWLDVSDDQNNFQIEALAEHQMLLNQIVNWQERLADFIIDFERKHAHVNGPLMKKLVTKISENKKLWSPDSKEKLEGSDEEIIKMILVDFLTNLKAHFPIPSSVETTAKLKDSLDTVSQLVESWVAMAGHSGNLKQIAELLGIPESDDGEGNNKNLTAINEQVKSVLTVEAFRRYNLPMPFDDILNDGKGGGLASLVNAVVSQRQNVGEFLAALIAGTRDADAKVIKAHAKKIDKADKDLQEARDKANLPEGDQNALENTPPGEEEEPEGIEEEEGSEAGTEGEEEEETSPEGEEGNEDGTNPEENSPDTNPFA